MSLMRSTRASWQPGRRRTGRCSTRGRRSATVPVFRGVPAVPATGQRSRPLETRIKELTALRVGVVNHCRYTTSHRYTAASANGATDADLAAVARGDYRGFTPRERIALQLADAMTTELPACTREQSPSGVCGTASRRGERTVRSRELVELTMSISVWNALSRFHRVMEFDLDMPEPPPAVESLI